MFLDCNKSFFNTQKLLTTFSMFSLYPQCFIVSSCRIFSVFMSKTKRKQEKKKLFSSGDYKEMALTTRGMRDQ